MTIVADKLLRLGYQLLDKQCAHSLPVAENDLVDAIEVCDAVWLAAIGLAPTTILRDLPTSGTAENESKQDQQLPSTNTPQNMPKTSPHPTTAEVGIHSTKRGQAGPGEQIKISGAPAIARRLEIDRSLRPLRRRLRNRYRLELDVDATVTAICETHRCVPIFSPARDRWLHIVLVVEKSPTMRLWQETANEWREALVRGAAPRKLSFLEAEWTSSGLSLRDRAGSVISPRSTIVPGRSTLIVYLSDAVGPGWMTADVPKQLQRWTKNAAVMFVQVLPPQLWDFSSLRRGMPLRNDEHSSVRSWHEGVSGLRGVLACHLNPADIGNVASYLSGRASAPTAVLPKDSTCYVDPLFDRFASIVDFNPADIHPEQVDQTYEEFIRFGSLQSRLVAQHLACVPEEHDLTLPLMRLIQRTLVSDAVPWQFAEVFLSGLMYRDRRNDASTNPAYDFVGNIRQRLRADAGMIRRVETRTLVSRYLREREGKGSMIDVVVPSEMRSGEGTAVGKEPIATLPETMVGKGVATVLVSSEGSVTPAVVGYVEKGARTRGSGDRLSVNSSVFISCVTNEFENEGAPFPGLRRQLCGYLARAGVNVRVQEVFPQTAVDTIRKLADEIRPQAVVVHLVGEMSGSIADAAAVEEYLKGEPDFLANLPALRAALGDFSGISYTQWEAFIALHHDIPLLVYATDKSSAQRTHLDRLKIGRRYATAIKNDTDLLGKIMGDLHKLLPVVPKFTRKISGTQLAKHAPRVLFGREAEMATLDAAWVIQTQNIFTQVGWGGSGKTSLVFHWVQTRFAAKGWPGVERYFDWSFYSQGTGESRQTSADLFIHKALEFFGDPDPTRGGPHERGERLAGLIRQHRTLLILDGIEPLQYPPNDPQAGRLKDPALETLLRELAADNPGLVVITTREHLTSVEGHAATEEQKLDKLNQEEAVALLRHLQIVGTDEELLAAWRDAGGHALTLSLLGRFIADAYEDRDIRHYREVKFEAADQEHQGRSAFKVMIAYERWLQSGGPERQRELAVLRLTGLFDRPMAKSYLQALRAEPSIPGLTDALVTLTPQQWNIAVKRLSEVELLSVSPDAIDAHPLIREYFALQLQRDQPEAFRAAHSRLFDYLCETTPHRPDGLDGLAPLYEAVTHGCLAGRQQEAFEKVYHDRILRGSGSGGFYSTRKLGAIGANLAAVAAFFDEPWSQVSPNLTAADQAWLLNEAAFNLRAVGNLTDALQPMRASLERFVRRINWKSAAISASNLSELEVTLGRLPDAVVDARQAITHADQSGDSYLRLALRNTAAEALHQSGKRAEAGTLFAEAERLQQERQPQFDLLYSLRGFQYCDWLLVPAEQAAWQHRLNQPISNSKSQLADALAEVERRATTTLKWAIDNNLSLLDIALDHLTLARVGLIRAILSPPLPQPTLDLPHVAAAVNGLRAAGTTHELPRGLLTAALYHFVRGEPALVEKHLAEAQQIAERGPMPLFLADIHLTRARLFRNRAELTKAAKLIRDLGYGRRTKELADAEAALGKE